MVPWLVTDRIELHPLSLDHLEDIFELHSHPDVMRYIGISKSLAKMRTQV
jgi:RimJ/RimL family protein N-acetyltransferase